MCAAYQNNVTRARGFTLIELIVVMVILAILASIGVGFVVNVMTSYQQTQNRALIVNSARPALERMTRQLRLALPYSVRIVNSGSCVEFMPIAGGGNYLDPVPDSKNLISASSTIPVAPYAIEYGTARHLAIGAMSATEIYGASAGSRATYGSGSSPTALALGSAKQWLRNSANYRFYLLDNPQAFCVVANQLRYYTNQNVANANVDLSATFALLSDSVALEGTGFSLEGAGENNNVKVNMRLAFSKGGESMLFVQGVMIRNVP